MGMGQRRDLAKHFKQQTDQSTGEAGEPDLFSDKPVEGRRTYECFREPPDSNVKEGARVKLVDMQNRIDVFVGVHSVGYVLPEAAEQLRGALRLAGRPGRSVSATIVEIGTLTPTFVVAVAGK